MGAGALFMLIAGILLTKLCSYLFWRTAKIYFAGADGEKKALKEIETALPDTYHVFANVKVQENMEADMVVVGPAGVFDVEVKNYNGRLEADVEQDTWTLHKYGRKGGEYGKEIKSPIRQLKRNIHILAGFLRENNIHVWVDGAILFVNPNTSFSSTRMNLSNCFMSGKALGDQILQHESIRQIPQHQVNQICTVLDSCTSSGSDSPSGGLLEKQP